MYRALYRKWRPRQFGDVIGQEAITAALAGQIEAGKIAHAYLFTGTRGTGKTSCAKIFAKAVNCENPAGAEPCGQCDLCIGLENGSILDVMEIDAASNNGVDDVRDLREETVYRPSRGRYRVYIIDEVHMLTPQAFNALLKTLEEPPGHVIFILATTEIHKVPATILSRCQRFDFGRIPAEKIAKRLTFIAKEEGIALDTEAADLLARLGDGSMRDATSLLDTCAGLGQKVDAALVRRMAGVADRDYLFAFSEAVRKADNPALLQLCARLRHQSLEPRRLCEELAHHYRNLLLARAAPDGSLLESVPAAGQRRYLDEAAQLPEAAAIAAIHRLASAMDAMGRSPDPRIELELALFDLGQGGAAATPAHPSIAAAQRPAEAAKPVETAKPAVSPMPAATAPAAPVPGDEAASVPASDTPTPDDNDNAPAAPPPEAEKPAPPATVAGGAAAPASGPQPFEAWPQVLQRMAGRDQMLYTFMKDSAAYSDGTRVLIDGGELFLTFMRTNDDAKERIKTAIAEVTGKRYGLGPYEAPKPKEKEAPTAQDTLRQWEAMGVDVQYE